MDIETDHVNSTAHSANPSPLSVSASIVQEDILMDITSIDSLSAAPSLFSRESKLPASYDKKSYPHKENGEDRQQPLTTPAVRKLAKEMGLDLSLLRGTGPGGRILKEDLNMELDRGEQILTAHSSATAQLLSQSKQISKAQAEGTHVPSRHTVPLRGIQRLMARSMTESLKVPQLTYTDDVRCEEMMLARKKAKAQRGAEKGSASIMPLIIKATSMALKQYPIMNCSVLCPDCSEIVYNDDHNIGEKYWINKGIDAVQLITLPSGICCQQFYVTSKINIRHLFFSHFLVFSAINFFFLSLSPFFR